MEKDYRLGEIETGIAKLQIRSEEEDPRKKCSGSNLKPEMED